MALQKWLLKVCQAQQDLVLKENMLLATMKLIARGIPIMFKPINTLNSQKENNFITNKTIIQITQDHMVLLVGQKTIRVLLYMIVMMCGNLILKRQLINN